MQAQMTQAMKQGAGKVWAQYHRDAQTHKCTKVTLNPPQGVINLVFNCIEHATIIL